jgi:16S rRNA A1518/A1519 N6-dimethyltransferase RsmA/KsgA/DIM1 with predicted DNA glycosylase/AP lyase activity
MLRASLKNLPGAIEAITELGLDPSMRAEQLSVADFCRLSAHIQAQKDNSAEL